MLVQGIYQYTDAVNGILFMMEKYYDAQSVEDIFETIPGNSCPLCVKADATFVSRDIFKRHFEFKHYRRAVNCMVNSKEGMLQLFLKF